MSKDYSILIVDDSLDDRYLLRRYLGKTDLALNIIEAVNGREALDWLLQPIESINLQHPNIQAPIVVFLDINMPIMNGWEFLDAIDEHKGQIALKPTVVLMYTTSNSETERQKASRYPQICDYITKDDTQPDRLKSAILTSCGA